jgi:putative flippase GtrA
VLIAFRYVLFAAISMLANLGMQEVLVRLWPNASLTIPILAGTIVGFLVKYFLDKRWIFVDRYTGPIHELRKVILYGAFSVLTTFVFWIFEVSFWVIWQTDTAKYAGAVLGLSIGYGAKYALDRNIVFGKRDAQWSSTGGDVFLASSQSSSPPRRRRLFRAFKRMS